MVESLNEQNFEKEVLESKVPVLVDFWAEWCAPCRMLSPIIDSLAGKYSKEKIKIYKLNVDENPAIAAKYSIMAIPTIIIFKDGKVVERVTGIRPEKDFIDMIERVINL